ncbi:MAG: M23 family metallopeptidase [Gammaproteobacteria bacterium]
MDVRVKFSKRELAMIASFTVIFFLVDLALFFEQDPIIPVEGASARDWNHNAFWHEPWGGSGVHKGIDIFARRGTPALASVSGWVVFQGELKLGGNALMILEPKWRLHYYAHLDSVSVGIGDWVPKGKPVGTVGNTGNARGRPTHLHYGVMSLIPCPTRYSDRTQGWKLMFYLDPDKYLRKS